MGIALRFAPYIAAVLAAAGVYWWIYHSGVTDERNANAGRVLVESEESRRLREGNDGRARSLDDEKALLCLANPAGCRR